MKCCKCNKAGAFQNRLAVPAIANADTIRWLHTSDTYCLDHRKAGPRASELLTPEVQAFLTQSMAPALPDFAKAAVEWSAL